MYRLRSAERMPIGYAPHMAPLFWSAKLSASMRIRANANCLLAWVTGAARDVDAMRRHMKSGYEAELSDDVRRYDELCLDQYSAIARALLDGVDVDGLEVADIGCGTGALAFECLARGAKSVACADVSELMLDCCREKAREGSCGDDRIAFHLLDGPSGQLKPGRFDAALSSMLLGLVPDPEAILSDAARIVRPGGTVAVATHGPAYGWEAVDAAFRAIPRQYVLGYRIEFWPQYEALIRDLLERTGMTDVRTARRAWTLEFGDPGDALGFFCASSSAFWYAKIPPEVRERVAARLRSGFRRRGVRRVTHDTVFGYGRRAAASGGPRADPLPCVWPVSCRRTARRDASRVGGLVALPAAPVRGILRPAGRRLEAQRTKFFILPNDGAIMAASGHR